MFWLGALAIGLVSVAFALLADGSHRLFVRMFGGGDGGLKPSAWALLAITPLVFALCAWLADRFFPGAQGSGIPQAIAARHLRDSEDRGGLLTLRIASGKIALTLLALLFGASVGREGPTVQVGAALMLTFGRLGDMARAPGLILAGSAAGIAAAFNTPLAGIVFAIEEMSRSYQSRTNGLVLSAVVIAGIASLALMGSYTYFGETSVSARFPDDWPLVIATGVAGGLAGALFSLGALRLVTRIRRWKAMTGPRRAVTVAFAAGLVVAILGLATNGATFGTGYAEARGAIEGQALPLPYFAAKFLTTLASVVSGIPGGLFAPSLSVGAGLGSTIGVLIGADITLAAILGMAGYFAGVVQAPLTTIVIIVEMTGNHDNILPVMASAMIGYGISRVIAPEPLYHALSRLWLADAIRKRRTDAHAPEQRGIRPESPSS